ncbi:MAG: tetraacyldisaccharide 4'-kinase [Porticoccaceae bacterium]|nr:tetraacyldisaccharide 4'-kinase [Porticoccaceae bacterium]
MNSLERAWYRKPSWSQVLLPGACLFQTVASLRKRTLQKRYQGKAWRVPLIVIGNINVGGTGKTPLIIALTQQLAAKGIKVGIVSRGYGGNAGSDPMSVIADSAVEQCGDEALLIARRTNCPVVVCADRRAAVEYLLEQHELDVILSDDGLQHYRMHRDLEIVVIDRQRGLGNGHCLPAGPLRESPARLNSVDGIVINGAEPDQEADSLVITCQAKALKHSLPAQVPTFSMSLEASHFINLSSGEKVSAEQWSQGQRAQGQSVHAVAGIGNPERFRDTLIAVGLQPQLHSFPDHHVFTGGDLNFDDDWPLIMTAKDAVKCESLSNRNYWYLDVEAVLPPELVQLIENQLSANKDSNNLIYKSIITN